MNKIIVGLVAILLLLFTLTGCNTINETFGKEYLIVDNFYDQLEADISYSIREYTSTQKDYSKRKSEIENQISLLKANMKISKNEMKSNIADFKKYAEEIGYKGSVEDYIDKTLLESRIGIEKELKKATGGKLTLKHTEVKRDLLGTIWHFVRNNWIISLIILGVIGFIIEKLEELFSRRKVKTEKNTEA